ncbi:HD domain-containing phosphohydrolase [Sporomusa aerivorans]|uniref:HD-GYP domain-containing protein n=1 Tax=Sporomusa aerivorans TaxID=204936 RepID=UPI00352A8AA9
MNDTETSKLEDVCQQCPYAAIDRELKEQVHFLQILIDSIPNPIFYKDKHGIYKGCNTAFEAYIGLPRKELTGKSVFDISPKQLAQKYFDMDNDLLNYRGRQEYESRVKYADGSFRDVIFNKATFNSSSGELAGIVGAIVDVSKQKQIELALKQTSEKLSLVLNQTVQAMATITEMRDIYTAGHQQRVSGLSLAIAREMNLPEDTIQAVEVAALLHDIGKISIPSEILTKPGKLSFHEFEIVKGHSETGFEILKSIDFPYPVAEIVRQHHERLDGSGYPRGLSGKEVLLEARILMVADVVEAISSHRPYRPALGIVKAITEINLLKGIQYDSDVVEACLKVFEKGYAFDAV